MFVGAEKRFQIKKGFAPGKKEQKMAERKPVSLKLATDEERAVTEAKLQPWLDEIQKRCTARTIDTADIQKWVKAAEGKITGWDSHKISQKALEGTEIECDPRAQSFPRKYTKLGMPSSTHFRARFHAGKWQVTEIWREGTGTNHLSIKLSDTAKEAVIDAIQKRW